MNTRKGLLGRWILAIVPLLLGAAFSIWLNATGRAPLLRISVDLGTVLFGLGLIISLVSAAVLGVQRLLERTRRDTAAEATQERQRFLRRLDHELKNPLTAILAGLANAGQPAAGGEQEAAPGQRYRAGAAAAATGD